MRPQTRYAQVADAYVAYQVLGDSPLIDVVYVPSFYNNIEAMWEVPSLARFMERIASFSRLLVFDRRGHGMSDPVAVEAMTLEHWMEDLRAVLSAVSSQRAVVIGAGESGPLAVLFGATYPDLTSGVVLFDTYPTMARREDYPWGAPEQIRERIVEAYVRAFVEDDPQGFYWFFPSFQENPAELEVTRRGWKQATTPGRIRQMMDAAMKHDVRSVLPALRVPTLVLHRVGDQFARVEHGRYLGQHIPNVKYVELEGADHFPWIGDSDSVLDEIEEFVTGARPVHHPYRVLATVLFTDVVSSTQLLAKMGDQRWRQTRQAHASLIEAHVARFQGRLVSVEGEESLATFDGPARAIRCALAIKQSLEDLGLRVRAGLHTGEIELMNEGIAGIAVHLGARVSAMAGPGEILVSHTVKDLVFGSGLEFEDRGGHELKGVPGRWRLYSLKA